MRKSLFSTAQNSRVISNLIEKVSICNYNRNLLSSSLSFLIEWRRACQFYVRLKRLKIKKMTQYESNWWLNYNCRSSKNKIHCWFYNLHHRRHRKCHVIWKSGAIHIFFWKWKISSLKKYGWDDDKLRFEFKFWL